MRYENGNTAWTFDAVKNRMELSDEMYRLLGLSPSAIEPSTSAFMAFVHPDDTDHVPAIDRWSPDQFKTYSSKYRIIRTDGTVRVIHSDVDAAFDPGGHLVSMDGVDQDITERRQAEAVVRDSEARLRSLIHHSSSAISLKNMYGQYTFANRKFTHLLGRTGENVIGKTVDDLCSPELSAAVDDGYEATAQSGEPLTLDSTLSVDGREHALMMIKFSVRDDADNMTGLGTITTDITERKQADAEQADLEARLAQSQRLEAIGTLAGGIAHNFNNILAAMTGNAHLAHDATSEESPVHHDVEGIIKGIDRAAGLVQQILTFGRQGDTGRRPIDVGRAIPEVLDFIDVSVPSTIGLTRNIDDNPGFILANPTQLHQVLMNLCGNALDAIGDGPSAIKVVLETIDADDLADADRPRVRADQYLRLSVCDDGVSMDETTKGQAFNPFFTTKSVGKGTGLGLAVVHGIVGSNGGVIAIDSSPGQGTAVTIHFPCVNGPTDADERESHQQLPRGTGQILLVDDESEIVETQKRILGGLGYDVEAVECGTAALELVRAAPDKYDLLITDQTMPRLTGDELAHEV